MEYTRLGSTGLQVSRICLGMMSYGTPSWREWVLDIDTSRPLVRSAVDAGITFFDTADVYSLGVSEEVTGTLLREHFADREDYVLATKVFSTMSDRPNDRGLSRKHVMAGVDASLRRLGTDYVDLYQIHRMDPATPIEETLEALHDVVKAGKVRYLGASSMHAWEFSKVLHLQREHGWARFVSMQDHYNLLAREEEREMLPLCADEGVGTIPWSPLARGRLTREWNASTDRSGTDPFADMLYTQESSDRAIIEAVGKIAEARGVTRAQVSLAWLRRNPVVVAPLVGASKQAHLDDAVASLEIELTDDEVAELEARYTPRHDFQGISDNAELARISARLGISPAGS